MTQSYLLITFQMPSQTCPLNPKLKSTGAGRYSFFPVVGCLPQAAWPEELLSKSQDAVALQQIKALALYLWLMRGDIRQAIDRCSNIKNTRALVMVGQFEHKANDSWLQNSKKRAERSEIDVVITAIISALVICIIVCLSWAVINHYRDNAVPIKLTRQNAKNWSWRTRQLLTWMRQRDVAALDAKYTKELAVLKLKMMLCVMMLPLVVVGCTSKQSVSQCVKPPPPRRWNSNLPWLADTAERIITAEKADHYAKTTGGEPRSILMSSADRVAHIDGQLM